MIIVKFTKTHKCLSISVDGHACSAEAGKDLICAGASTLIYTLAQYVKDSDCTSSVIELSPGNSTVKAITDYKNRVNLEDAYELVMTGFRLLEHNFPDNVRLEAGPPA